MYQLLSFLFLVSSIQPVVSQAKRSADNNSSSNDQFPSKFDTDKNKQKDVSRKKQNRHLTEN